MRLLWLIPRLAFWNNGNHTWFWKPEPQTRGVSMAVLSLRLLKELSLPGPSQIPWFLVAVAAWLHPLLHFYVPSVISVPTSFLSLTGKFVTGLRSCLEDPRGPHVKTFNYVKTLTIQTKDFLSKEHCTHRCWGQNRHIGLGVHHSPHSK